jgi:hypothetical protein
MLPTFIFSIKNGDSIFLRNPGNHLLEYMESAMKTQYTRENLWHQIDSLMTKLNHCMNITSLHTIQEMCTSKTDSRSSAADVSWHALPLWSSVLGKLVLHDSHIFARRVVRVYEREHSSRRHYCNYPLWDRLLVVTGGRSIPVGQHCFASVPLCHSPRY